MADSRRVVLIGKSGSGKSSLANTIFGGSLFKVNHSSDTKSKFSESQTRTVNGLTITLIDTPGIFNADRTDDEVDCEIFSCLTQSAPGPLAFVFVLLVEKFTEQEQAIAEQIKLHFGEDVYRYTIVVFTHGDQLQEEFVDHVIDNKSWKSGQGRCHVSSGNTSLNSKGTVTAQVPPSPFLQTSQQPPGRPKQNDGTTSKTFARSSLPPHGEHHEVQVDRYRLHYMKDCPKAGKWLKEQLAILHCTAKLYPEDERVVVRRSSQLGATSSVDNWKTEVNTLFKTLENHYSCHYEIKPHKRKALLESSHLQTEDDVKVYSEDGMAIVVGQEAQVNARLNALQEKPYLKTKLVEYFEEVDQNQTQKCASRRSSMLESIDFCENTTQASISYEPTQQSSSIILDQEEAEVVARYCLSDELELEVLLCLGDITKQEAD